jgi:hypothetical protein
VHDVFERGTLLDTAGRPQPGARALPDGEIVLGTPIPALVPLPTLAMAPMPAQVKLVDNGRRAEVQPEQVVNGKSVYKNPGYPFFVPGVAGHRAPHPPLDFAWEEEAPGQPKRYTAAQAQAEQAQVGKPVLLNGGLPRHLVLDGETVREFHTRWDFTKDFVLYDKEDKKDPSRIAIAGGLVAFELPEEGTAVEQAAMAAHAQRAHASFQPNGDRGNFLHNGLPPTHGAPFADPSVDDDGNAVINTRRYQAAVMQMDVVLNKQGWHYPQQRFIALWEDVKPTVSGARAPQPFFFRANTGESVEYWHTNLVPDYYELDDFQVRTPTDILGQHIHLVKFDVMASDGAGNGFNYEDGTFSPDEVRGRIDAINRKGGLYGFDDKTQFIDRDPQKQRKLQAKPAPAVFGTPPPGQNWTGAQTTIQRWDTDPLLNNEGEDRTLRTVFTHDHFGPSTHQQIGLYGGLLVEPENSTWYDPVTGGLLYDTTKRRDGGPTGWQANIITADPADSYREFALEFQDFQLAYTSNSSATPTTPTAALFNICPTPNNEPSCQLTDLINQLNRGGTVTPAVSNAFAQNGVTLSPNATIVVQTPGSKWQLSNPYYIPAGGQPDCNSPSVRCDRYPIVNNTSTQLVGLQVSISPVVPGWSNPQFAVNPPSDSSNTANGPPYPTLISTGGAVQGTYSLMYRNEPLPLRVNPSPPNQASSLTPEQQQQAVDLSQVFRSIPRRDATLNIQPNPGAPLDQQQPSGFKFPPDLVPTCHPNDPPELRCLPSKQQPTDPYTPLLRAYENDRVQIRTLVGGQLVSHTFQVHGVKWLYEPTSPNSGYRNVQGMGLSEHFEMLFTLPPASTTPTQPFADYVYAPSSGQAGLTNGLWGILRAYQGVVADLQPLPNNPQGMAPPQLKSDCPSGAPVRSYAVVATTAAQALPGGVLVYNSDQSDPLAIVYVRAEDLDAQGKLKPGVPIEPLVLRAAAGECIEITLQNNFDPQCATPNAQQPQCATFTKALAAPAPFTPPSSTGALPTINLNTSLQVGLHPQLVAYDVSQANGINVGLNPPKTVAPGQPNQIFRWYAGSLTLSNTGDVVARPVEFGALNLVPSDPLMQDPKGLVGALIIEPPGATWTEDPTTRAAATVTAKKEDGTSSSFREFVVVMQSDAMEGNLLTFNYKTNVAASTLHLAEPLTPIFPAVAGTPVRFRVVYPGGDGDFVVAVHGHSWQEEPYVRESTEIGSNPLSQWFGGQQLTPYQSLNLVLPSAGGPFQVQGDYLYQVYLNAFASGQWGIFRVSPIVELATVPQPPVAAPARVTPAPATPPVLRSQKRSQR